MLINRRKIRVQWGDCDPGGIVYFPRYFEYCDVCTDALFERAGLAKRKIMKVYAIAGIPMVQARAQFFVPSEFGETIVAESRVSEWGRSSFVVHHRLFKGKTLALEVFEKRVWVVHLAGGSIRYKGQTIPQEVKKKLSGSHRASRRR